MSEVIVWPGWAGGIAIGLYAIFQYAVTGRALGVSSAYGNLCGLVTTHPFFREGRFSDPTNWRLWFIIGLPLGGLLAALTSPSGIEMSFNMGAMYESVLPEAFWAKGGVLFAGGSLIGFGARLAGGCPSGHSIAGMSLLNPPSFLASAGFFIGGIIMVQLLFNIL
ncbi:MAG: YeeE/YedE thiosulfate transporter family protein [Calditrichota bacterium]